MVGSWSDVVWGRWKDQAIGWRPGLAIERRRNIFGDVGATPKGEVEHLPALPVRGPIDFVGDSVTANLAAALASGATVREALEMANAAGSVVIHKLGTTGTASVEEIGELVLDL